MGNICAQLEEGKILTTPDWNSVEVVLSTNDATPKLNTQELAAETPIQPNIPLDSAAAPPPPAISPELIAALLSIPPRPIPAVNQPIECRISCLSSLQSFWLHLEPSFDQIDSLSFSQHEGGVMDPAAVVPGVHCLVEEEDGIWYRARVLQILSAPLVGPGVADFTSPQVHVRLVDYGGEALVPLVLQAGFPTKIRSLPAGPAPPPAAHLCCLKGFEDFDECGGPLHVALAAFEELVEREDVKLFVSFVSHPAANTDEPSLVRLVVQPSDTDVANAILSARDMVGTTKRTSQ